MTFSRNGRCPRRDCGGLLYFRDGESVCTTCAYIEYGYKNVDQISQYVDKDVRTVWRWIGELRLEPIPGIGRDGENVYDLDEVEAIKNYPNTRRTLYCRDGTVKMQTSLLAEFLSGQRGCSKRNLDLLRASEVVSGSIDGGRSMVDVVALQEHLGEAAAMTLVFRDGRLTVLHRGNYTQGLSSPTGDGLLDVGGYLE